jgi:glutamate-1-semialdehyde 2,1-aminomutase
MSALDTKGLTNKEMLTRASNSIVGGSLAALAIPDEVGFVAARGKGSKIWDLDGNRYIDYAMGSGPLLLGHCPDAVVEAVRRQIELGSTLYVINPLAIQLAEKIIAVFPCAELVRFIGTGSEAAHYALRLARAYTGRDKVLKFEGGYHGCSDYALMSQFPRVPAEFPKATVDSAGIPAVLRDQMVIAPFNDADLATKIIRQYAPELAAVLVEPLQRTIVPKKEFLQAVREVTSEVGVPLVFDEIVTGFRIAYGGAQERYGVVPDLASFGKVIGGGYPVGAIGGRRDIMELADPRRRGDPKWVFVSGTFSGNPITCAAGLAAIAELERPGTYEGLHQIGGKLRKGMAEIADRLGEPIQVAGEDACFQVFFTNKEISNYRATLQADSTKAHHLAVEMIRRGVLWGGEKFYLSTAHSDEDADETLNVFESALKVVVGRA